MNPRYQRQTVLAEIGPTGQVRLAQARVLVVGAGGLGAPVLLYLAAAGVGQQQAGGCLTIVDDDVVDLSNLQRQVLFNEADLGQAKALAAAQHLRAMNGDLDIRPVVERLSADNVAALFDTIDIVVDGTDNFASKYLINDAAVKFGKPVVYGSILGFEGQASVFAPARGEQAPCYRCLFPEAPQNHVPNCAEFGTLGGIAGLVGSIQAIEVCKLALGEAHCATHGLEPLIGKLWWVDARTLETRRLTVRKKADCTVCQGDPATIQLQDGPAQACASRSPSAPLPPALSFAAFKDHPQPYFLLDVREPAEWDQGHLPSATLLPLANLLNDPAPLPTLPEHTEVLVYCQMGVRSQTAVRYLRQQGINARTLLVDWSQIAP